MIVKDLKGRPCTMPTTPYLIDWDHVVSKPQKRVKDFLRPFWFRDMVLEEPRLPRSLLRFDIINASRGIVVEVSPTSTHGKFNPFLHGSRMGFGKMLARDMEKERWAELNEFTFIEITDADFPLTTELFATRWKVTLTPCIL